MAQPVKRKVLLTALLDEIKTVSKVEIQEITMDIGVDAPLHLHPCPTMGVVTEGKIVFEIEGEQSQHLEVGDAFYEPANATTRGQVSTFDKLFTFGYGFLEFSIRLNQGKETWRVPYA